MQIKPDMTAVAVTLPIYGAPLLILYETPHITIFIKYWFALILSMNLKWVCFSCFSCTTRTQITSVLPRCFSTFILLCWMIFQFKKSTGQAQWYYSKPLYRQTAHDLHFTVCRWCQGLSLTWDVFNSVKLRTVFGIVWIQLSCNQDDSNHILILGNIA